MKLEKNGKQSNGKQTRHINIHYYVVMDRIAVIELTIELCPTLEMIGNFFTKPLQRSHFRGFRNTIISIEEDDIPSYNAEARAKLEANENRVDSGAE